MLNLEGATRCRVFKNIFSIVCSWLMIPITQCNTSHKMNMKKNHSRYFTLKSYKSQEVHDFEAVFTPHLYITVLFNCSNLSSIWNLKQICKAIIIMPIMHIIYHYANNAYVNMFPKLVSEWVTRNLQFSYGQFPKGRNRHPLANENVATVWLLSPAIVCFGSLATGLWK